MDFTIADINKAIDTLVKSQQRSVEAVEKVLVMSVYCSIQGIEGSHIAVANTLLKVLRKSTKRDAIVGFLEHYGQLALVDKAFAHFTANEASRALAWTPEYIETVKLAAKSWEDFKKPTIQEELDLVKAIDNVIKKAEKAQKENRTVKNEKLMVELKSALARFHAASVAG